MSKMRAGFNLIELSIVVLIIGVLVSVSVSLGTSQLNIVNIKSTQNKLDKIDQAIALYLKVNNSLPCPADGTLALGSANFGKESKTNPASPTDFSDATCTVVAGSDVTISGASHMYIGVIPTKALNLSDDYMFDAWGNRITYAVSKYCVDPQNWNGNYAHKCVNTATGSSVDAVNADGGNLTIQDISGTTAINGNNRATDAAYVVISHGSDGIGAYRKISSTTRIPRSANTSYQERANASVDTGGANETLDSIFADGFINDGTAISSGVYTKYFDDIVHWRTAPLIWEDAMASVSLPQCLTEQILQSNGGNTYSCTNGLIGKAYPQVTVFSTDTPPYKTIDLSLYPLAKIAMVETLHEAPSGGSAYVTYRLSWLNGSLADTNVTELYANTTSADITMEHTLILPIPANATTLLVTPSNDSGGSALVVVIFMY